MNVYARYFAWRLRQPVWLLAPITGAMFGVWMGVVFALGFRSVGLGLLLGAISGGIFAVFYPVAMAMQSRHSRRGSGSGSVAEPSTDDDR